MSLPPPTSLKKLRHIAAGIASSFIRRNNDVGGQWALGLLYRDAPEDQRMRLNLLDHTTVPSTNIVRLVARNYGEFLRRAALKQGVPLEELAEAKVELRFNADVRIPGEGCVFVGDAYLCTVTLTNTVRGCTELPPEHRVLAPRPAPISQDPQFEFLREKVIPRDVHELAAVRIVDIPEPITVVLHFLLKKTRPRNQIGRPDDSRAQQLPSFFVQISLDRKMRIEMTLVPIGDGPRSLLQLRLSAAFGARTDGERASRRSPLHPARQPANRRGVGLDVPGVDAGKEVQLIHEIFV